MKLRGSSAQWKLWGRGWDPQGQPRECWLMSQGALSTPWASQALSPPPPRGTERGKEVPRTPDSAADPRPSGDSGTAHPPRPPLSSENSLFPRGLPGVGLSAAQESPSPTPLSPEASLGQQKTGSHTHTHTPLVCPHPHRVSLEARRPCRLFSSSQGSSHPFLRLLPEAGARLCPQPPATFPRCSSPAPVGPCPPAPALLRGSTPRRLPARPPHPESPSPGSPPSQPPRPPPHPAEPLPRGPCQCLQVFTFQECQEYGPC